MAYTRFSYLGCHLWKNEKKGQKNFEVLPILCLYREAMHLHCLCPHTMWVGVARFAQTLLYRAPAGIVWLYYACSYTVALSPGTIPSFAVLHTAFQCATLLSWEHNLAVLYCVVIFRQSLFCLACRFLEKKNPEMVNACSRFRIYCIRTYGDSVCAQTFINCMSNTIP